jgi:hypothetical protein
MNGSLAGTVTKRIVRKARLNYRHPGTGGTVVAVETLSIPFSSWREGLLALAGALEDPDRERIVVDRLETTAASIGIEPQDICSLALLVPSMARLDPFRSLRRLPKLPA